MRQVVTASDPPNECSTASESQRRSCHEVLKGLERKLAIRAFDTIVDDSVDLDRTPQIKPYRLAEAFLTSSAFHELESKAHHSELGWILSEDIVQGQNPFTVPPLFVIDKLGLIPSFGAVNT